MKHPEALDTEFYREQEDEINYFSSQHIKTDRYPVQVGIPVLSPQQGNTYWILYDRTFTGVKVIKIAYDKYNIFHQETVRAKILYNSKEDALKAAKELHYATKTISVNNLETLLQELDGIIYRLQAVDKKALRHVLHCINQTIPFEESTIKLLQELIR